jgi:hypothetical protein
MIGALMAVVFYKLFKVMEYEMVNPGQDGDEANDPTQNPDHEIAQAVDERQAEVEEIQAIEQEGGFGQLSDIQSVEPSVLHSEGVVDGENVARMGNGESRRSGERDLEAGLKVPRGEGK